MAENPVIVHAVQTPEPPKMPKSRKGKNAPGQRPEKERERYYLLPGQGGQAYRRKQKFILKWAVLAALVAAAVVSAVLYLMNHSKP